MSSPNSADEIARSLADEIVRLEVVELPDQGWSNTLTLMVAPGGYGKTRALAQAVRSNEDDPVGTDRYLRLRPGHADPARLGIAILEALGIGDEPAADDEALVERIVDEFARFSPTRICLILDDVHMISSSTAVVTMLAEVIRLLPTNSQVLMAGRALPELPLARLAADDGLLEIDGTTTCCSARRKSICWSNAMTSIAACSNRWPVGPRSSDSPWSQARPAHASS